MASSWTGTKTATPHTTFGAVLASNRTTRARCSQREKASKTCFFEQTVPEDAEILERRSVKKMETSAREQAHAGKRFQWNPTLRIRREGSSNAMEFLWVMAKGKKPADGRFALIRTKSE